MLPLLIAALAVPQDDAADKTPPDFRKAMEMAAAAGEPGDAHKVLDKMAGTWDVEARAYFAPGAPPAVSRGTQVNRWTLGGRWLNGEYEGDFMGRPFAGLARYGHDNTRGQYVSTWTDTYTTGLMTETGTYDAATKTLTMTGEVTDPLTNQAATAKSVTRFESADRYTVTSYGGPGDADAKTIELIYTRKQD